MSTVGANPYVDHDVLTSFAAARVNLPKAEVDEHRAQVNRLRDHLQRLIEKHEHYSLIKTLHSGSVAKGTALKSVSDMDVAAYLDASKVPSGEESKLLSELQTMLRAAYGDTKSADDFIIQTHSVKVHFWGSGLDIDVAPIVYEGLADDRGFLVTEDNNRVETSIKLHKEFIQNRKNLYGADYAQVIRLMKYWVRYQKSVREDTFRCKSFLVELIVAHLADNGLALDDYSKALESIFAWIVQTDLAEVVWFDDYCIEDDIADDGSSCIRVYDPVNATNNVCKAYTEANRRELVEAAADALDSITAAQYGTTQEYAVNAWREVFGPTFRIDL